MEVEPPHTSAMGMEGGGRLNCTFSGSWIGIGIGIETSTWIDKFLGLLLWKPDILDPLLSTYLPLSQNSEALLVLPIYNLPIYYAIRSKALTLI